MDTSHYLDDDARWQALKARDLAADNDFVVAVPSTGYYSPPSQILILPARDNVEFFRDGETAEAAGYTLSEVLSSPKIYPEKWLRIVKKSCFLIESAEQLPDLSTLAKYCAVSGGYLHRIFKSVTGLTPKAYSEGLRAARLREELNKPQQSVCEAIYQAGFNANSRFYENASQRLGMSAKHYRRGAAGVTIYFALGQCSLGSVLVAQSEKGVCAISLGDEPESLITEFQQQFPHATLMGGDTHYEHLVAQVIGFIEQPSTAWDLPLDIKGTVFQERVWRALQEIPLGTTVSYTDIAEKLGSPKSVRAVAQACAANRLAIVIPCHRVVKRDGQLSGYRWGVARKEALLRREKNANKT
ncbi:bifunctional DNA-binding transcriptional regulator/O6-methylguanine-DNA methyltransferase Ada [Tatumella ptyseos]|uniref:bifunctional DNA-binding transcriptional regulator/O6-methylguanine-DNA methyltransferase Ada n=1 Tax=Tatumella ptyseos TaxID=82987 RepID=UPI0026F0F5B7|nr:bifunctional DNA-binding transcriptional regulator/O6-methylguanine-DNA methyltransferase Ada [Tatumella ptyseos]WKX27888.1 bifunctional DNA-binding transcriptional regulator/O6-methylguanine-DNA methyltransferase Ada [Tatumella ptyseos]